MNQDISIYEIVHDEYRYLQIAIENKTEIEISISIRKSIGPTCLICLVFLSIRVGKTCLLFELIRVFSCNDDTTARTLTSSP
jgi:hypothetical protein